MSERATLRYVNGKYVRDTRELAARMLRSRHDSWTTTQDVPSGRLRVVAYSPYGRVAWSRSWQEAKEKAGILPIEAIVNAVSREARELVAKLEEVDRLAEIERAKWLAQQEQWRRSDDRRQVEKLVQDSREALGDVIMQWSRVVEVERFFQGVEDRAGALAEEERAVVLERLALAREFLGSNDPLDFFRAWRTPRERYQPRYEE